MKSYGDYLNRFFPGKKIQKISVDAGFTCPNRDGTIGTGGCIYCRNDSFTPRYCDSRLSVSEQIERGKQFFGRKYPEMKYLVYFQSYTGTYGVSTENLKKLYEEALSSQDVVGLVISTRPDCLDKDKLEMISLFNNEKTIFIEIGAETSHNETLRAINRNHTWQDVEKTVNNIAGKNLHCGLHLIAGLPGETNEMILETVKKAVALPIETLKIHQLQILKGTPLSEKWLKNEIDVKDYSVEEYLTLCRKIYDLVPENIIIERFLSQSPPDLVISPKWNLKNYEFMNKFAQTL